MKTALPETGASLKFGTNFATDQLLLLRVISGRLVEVNDFVNNQRPA